MSQRIEEKQDLIDLKSRVANYVQHVRLLGESTHHSSVYQSVEILEEEVKGLKQSYENQISQLKRSCELLTVENSELRKESEVRRRSETHLLNRLTAEASTNHKLVDEMNTLNKELVEKDQKLRNANASLNKAGVEAGEFQVKYIKSEQEVQSLTEKLHQADLSIKEAENRISELERQRMGGVCDEQIKSLQERLKMESEKTRYYQDDNHHLREEILHLQNKETQYKAKIHSLEQQVEQLEKNIQQEKAQAARYISTLETRLRESEEIMQLKLREADEARNSEISLRAEIDALRSIIEEEENRLQICGYREQDSYNMNYISDYGTIQDLTSSSRRTENVSNLPVQEKDSNQHYNPLPQQPVIQNGVHTVAWSNQAKIYSYNSTDDLTANKGIISDSKETGYPKTDFTLISAQGDVVDHAPKEAFKIINLDESYPVATEGDKFKPLSYGESKKESTSKIQGMTSPRANVTGSVVNQSANRVGRIRVHSAPVHRESTATETHAKDSAESAKKQRPFSSSGARLPVAQANTLRGGPGGGKVHTYNIGQIRDYFDEMFGDGDTLHFSSTKNVSNITQKHFNSSAIGELKFKEVNEEGKYIKIVNDSQFKDREFGGYMIQQNIGGHPVAMYRFPPRVCIPPGGVVTVYAGCCDAKLQKPPLDFVWTDYYRWKTGPECTSILCQPNGQAIAWTTATHRFNKNSSTGAEQQRSTANSSMTSCSDRDSIKQDTTDSQYASVQNNNCLIDNSSTEDKEVRSFSEQVNLRCPSQNLLHRRPMSANMTHRQSSPAALRTPITGAPNALKHITLTSPCSKGYQRMANGRVYRYFPPTNNNKPTIKNLSVTGHELQITHSKPPRIQSGSHSTKSTPLVPHPPVS